jgi:hypothetical protein
MEYYCGLSGNIVITIGFITGTIWIFKEEIFKLNGK